MKAPDAYIVLDTETTGLGQEARIIELAAIRVERGVITDKRSQLIDPGVWVSSAITELTGITNDMVRGRASIHQVLPRFLAFVGDLPIVGHNVGFDRDMLIREGLRTGVPVRLQIAADTLTLSRRLLPQLPGHRLQDMVAYFHIESKAAHRALADVYATQELYARLLDMTEK